MDIAHDMEVLLAGRTYWVPRELETLRRVEQQFGPLRAFVERIGRGHVTFDETLTLLVLLLRDQPGAPQRAEIEGLLWRHGAEKSARILAMPLYTLAMSEEEIAELVRVQQAAMKSKPPVAQGEAAAPGPFVPTDASTGPSSSSSRH